MSASRVTLAPQSDAILLLKGAVREIEDFPRAGIWTQDVTPLMQDARLFNALVTQLAQLISGVGCDVVAGVESRGFMIGPPLALALGKPFVPIVKASHALPDSEREAYTYEYGSGALALLPGPIGKGTRVVVVDDQIVTGGTVLAAAALVERIGAVVEGLAFVLVQSHYDGLRSVARYPVFALFEKNPSHVEGGKENGAFERKKGSRERKKPEAGNSIAAAHGACLRSADALATSSPRLRRHSGTCSDARAPGGYRHPNAVPSIDDEVIACETDN